MDFQSSLALLAPEIVLSLSGLALLLAAAWRSATNGMPMPPRCRTSTCANG